MNAVCEFVVGDCDDREIGLSIWMAGLCCIRDPFGYLAGGRVLALCTVWVCGWRTRAVVLHSLGMWLADVCCRCAPFGYVAGGRVLALFTVWACGWRTRAVVLHCSVVWLADVCGRRCLL